MSYFRRLIRPLVVLSLVATVLAAVSSPATAADVFVFTFESVDSPEWEVKVTVKSLGGCTPEQGQADYVSGWLGTDDESGVVLNTAVCSYRITAVARSSKLTGQVCEGVLAWGTKDLKATELFTNDPKRGTETVVSVLHAVDAKANEPICKAARVLSFTIDPDEVVEALPVGAADSNLAARAERAVEITDFMVQVRPDSTTADVVGCKQSMDVTVRGDDEEEDVDLEGVSLTEECKFRAYINTPPAPFESLTNKGVVFSTDDANSKGVIKVDLSELLKLPVARIVIIQDVVGSDDVGFVSYSIDRTCAGVGALPPAVLGTGGRGIFTLPGGQVVATLVEGRFTVHSPNFANFGPSDTYPAVATRTTSSSVAGCSVSVTARDLAENCTIARGYTQTLTWTAANPVSDFDFEFDITCSEPPAPATSTTELPPPPPPTTAAPATAAPATAAPTTAPPAPPPTTAPPAPPPAPAGPPSIGDPG